MMPDRGSAPPASTPPSVLPRSPSGELPVPAVEPATTSDAAGGDLEPAACHIGLLVADVVAAAEFYVHGLGARPDPTRSNEMFRALVLRGGVVLGLHTEQSWTGHGLDPAPASAPRVLIAYRPGSVADVDRLAAGLPALGATVIRSPHSSYGQRMALLADPDGHTLCLAHPEPEGTR